MKKFFSHPVVIFFGIILIGIAVILVGRWMSNNKDNQGTERVINNGTSVKSKIPQYVQDHTTGRFTKAGTNPNRQNGFLCDCMIRDTPNSPYHPVTIICSSKFASDCSDCCGLYEWHNSGRTK